MTLNRKKANLLVLVVVLAVASFAYRVIGHYGYSHTGLMFMGLPLVLAVLLILSGPSESSMGQAFKGVTLFLLLVGIVAWEGFICILMAAPLFYFFTFLLVLLWKKFRGPQVKSVAAIPLVLLALEGTHDQLSFERVNEVTLVRELPLTELALLERLSMAPEFDGELPAFLKMGFPYPWWAKSEGSLLVTGSVDYQIDFHGPDTLANTLRVRGERMAGQEVWFHFVEDSTKVGSWLTWQRAVMRWRQKGEFLEVTFRVQFQRNLDPYWYFDPIQRYAVGLACEYLWESWLDE